MKKILLIIAVTFVVGLLGSFFISQNLDANLEAPKDPHSHIGEKTLCYNSEPYACDD